MPWNRIEEEDTQLHKPAHDRSDRLSAPLFVGRNSELAELSEALGEAAHGAGRACLIAGEPGIGKTRLATEVAALAAARAFTVAWGHCGGEGSLSPYWPWTTILRHLVSAPGPLANLRSFDSAAAALGRVVPELTPPGIPTSALAPPTGDSDTSRFALFDAVTRFLGACSLRSPLLLILDDLRDADAASLALLQFIAREVRPHRLMILGTYREADVDLSPANAAAVARIARCGKNLPLRGLSETEVDQYVRSSTHTTPGAGVIAEIHRATAGNPFFVDELTRLLVAEHAIQSAAAIRRLETRVPHGVREAIRQRLTLYSEPARTALRTAAVFGESVELSILAQLVDLKMDEILDLIELAAHGGLVVPDAQHNGRFTFRHALIREVLCGEVRASERARLHCAAGEILERIHGNAVESRAGEIAHHFLEALPLGNAAHAARWALRAGREAAGRLAYEEAVATLQRALNALDSAHIADENLRLDVLLTLGDAQRRVRGIADPRPLFERAARIARQVGDTGRFARAAVCISERGIGVQVTAVDREVTALLEEALATHLLEDEIRIHVMARLAAELCPVGQATRCLDLSAEAIELARYQGGASTLAIALSVRHFVLWRRNETADRLDLANEIVRLAEECGDRELAAQGHSWRILDYMAAGHPIELEREVVDFTRFAEMLHVPRYLWLAANFRGMWALWQGHWDDAEVHTRESFDIADQLGEAQATAAALTQVFALRREQGRLAEEELKLRFLLERVPVTSTPRTLLAIVHLDAGQLAEAQAEFERVAVEEFEDLRREHRVGVLPYLAELCHAAGDQKRAAQLWDIITPLAPTNISVGAGVCLGSAARPLALLAATLARRDDADRFFQAALEQHRRMRAPALIARTVLEYAFYLTETGRRREATDRMNEAADLIDRNQLTGLRFRLDRLADDLAEPPAAEERQIAVGEPRKLPPERVAKVVPIRTTSTPERRRSAASECDRREPTPTLFRREGDFWSVGAPGKPLRLRNSKGLQYIATLLAAAGREIHALDLETLPAGGNDTAGALTDREIAQFGMRKDGSSDSGDVLDREARTAYRRRVKGLQEQFDEAQRFHDAGRIAALRDEIEFLARELSGAEGLGGRSRQAGAGAERSRVNVTRAVKAMLKRIAAADLDLGRYLDTTIRTGTFCSYQPDPRVPRIWLL